MLIIRPETLIDYPTVYETNKLAFDGRDAEPRLVEAVRQASDFIPELSLVAEETEPKDETHRVVGHILFSPITIETENGSIPVISLAPLAVHPEYQHRGIGSALVRHGLKECARLGHQIVIVLGHTNFYPRFGFSPALARPLLCPYGDCGDAWMALELVPGALNGVRGTVKYPKAFENV